jgi:hypothetical protein
MSSKSINKTLAALQAGGACVGENLHTFDFEVGEAKIPLAVIELPDAEFRKIIGNPNGYDRSELIAAAVRDPDGGIVFNKGTAGKLKPKVARDLEKMVMTHNGFGDDTAQAEAEGNG